MNVKTLLDIFMKILIIISNISNIPERRRPAPAGPDQPGGGAGADGAGDRSRECLGISVQIIPQTER